MQIWTGLACLVADPKCKEFRRFGKSGKGAWVNVVAAASSEVEFVKRVERIVPTLDCILLELDQVQLIEERIDAPESPLELFGMRAAAEKQPMDLVFGCFHVWTQSDIS